MCEAQSATELKTHEIMALMPDKGSKTDLTITRELLPPLIFRRGTLYCMQERMCHPVLSRAGTEHILSS